MQCTHCGNEYENHLSSCPYCGTPGNGQGIQCPRCGAFLEQGTFVCANCGMSITSGANNIPRQPINRNHSGKNNGLLITIVVLVVVLILGVIGVLAYLIMSDDDKTAANMNPVVEIQVPASETVPAEPPVPERVIPPEYFSGNDGYLFPSDRVYITENDLRGLTKEEVAYVRNEIYARRGYVFKTEPYKSYFARKSWYYPNVYFDESDFSTIEWANKEFIVNYERRMGWR